MVVVLDGVDGFGVVDALELELPGLEGGVEVDVDEPAAFPQLAPMVTVVPLWLVAFPLAAYPPEPLLVKVALPVPAFCELLSMTYTLLTHTTFTEVLVRLFKQLLYDFEFF